MILLILTKEMHYRDGRKLQISEKMACVNILEHRIFSQFSLLRFCHDDW